MRFPTASDSAFLSVSTEVRQNFSKYFDTRHWSLTLTGMCRLICLKAGSDSDSRLWTRHIVYGIIEIAMKPISLLLFAMSLLSLALGNASWAAGTLKVKAPNGGESWTLGTKYTIKWNTGNAGNRVKIELLKSGKTYKTVKAKTKNDGKFRWKIPSSTKASKKYTIRISSITDDSILDSSNKKFTIKSGNTSVLKVTSPNGGESWRQNNTYTITWDKGDVGGAVQIELLKADVSFEDVVSSTPNDGSYNWTIPHTLDKDDYKIRVRSKSSSDINDKSRDTFSVVGSTLKLRSPAFAVGGAIPKKYTCDGSDASPPLRISGVPGGTEELVLFLDDLDGSPTATNTTTDWNHWVVIHIPPEGKFRAYSAPKTATVATNDSGGHSWEPICPPGNSQERDKHNFRFTLYALDAVLTGGSSSTRAEVKTAMDGKILKKTTLDFYYGE